MVRKLGLKSKVNGLPNLRICRVYQTTLEISHNLRSRCIYVHKSCRYIGIIYGVRMCVLVRVLVALLIYYFFIHVKHCLREAHGSREVQLDKVATAISEESLDLTLANCYNSSLNAN